MRRTLAILAIGGLLATVVGAASTLAVDSASLQYGEDTTTCDTNGVSVHWGLESSGGLVHNVRLSNIAADCANTDIFVNVLGASESIYELEGVPVVDSTPTVEGDDLALKLNFPTPIPAADIFGVQVGIEGGVEG